MQIKFSNTKVDIKKLKQGVVVAFEDALFDEISYYHIKSFDCVGDNIAWLVISDNHGDEDHASDELIWVE